MSIAAYYKQLFVVKYANLNAGSAAASAPSSLRILYPAGKAIETGNLRVSTIHTVHYQVFGNPSGQPVLVVHGGPGAGCYANHA